MKTANLSGEPTLCKTDKNHTNERTSMHVMVWIEYLEGTLKKYVSSSQRDEVNLIHKTRIIKIGISMYI